MESKLEILEQLRTNIINTRDSDIITNELTEELNRIEEDLDKAIREEKQVLILEKELKAIELQNRLDEAFKKDDSHAKGLNE